VSTTVLDLITLALVEIRAIASGEPVSADDAALALSHLNGILDDAAIDRSKVYQTAIDSYTLTPGLSPHTIGVDPSGTLTATFAAARPTKITKAFIGTGASRKEMSVLTHQRYSDIVDHTTSGEPEGVYPDYSSPLCGLYFYPVPSSAVVYEQHSWKQVSELTDLTAYLGLPKGYRSYLLYELAFRLAGAFGASLHQATVDQRGRAIAALELINSESLEMSCDPVLLSGGSGYSIFTDN
jgi:hypothetical protein